MYDETDATVLVETLHIMELTEDARLRVAFLTPEFITEDKFDGGLANYLYRITVGMRTLGHAPEVFVLSDRDESIEFEGIIVHRVKRRPGVWWNRVKRKLGAFGGPRLDYSCYVRDGAASLAAAFETGHNSIPFDVVQASDFGATALALVPKKRRDYAIVSRLSYFSPMVRKAYGNSVTIDGLIAERLERSSLRNSDACYGPSERIARMVRDSLGINVEIVRPPIFCDTPETAIDESVYAEQLQGKRYVLFFGRICRLKGVYHLARSIKPVLQEHRDLLLVLVGREDPDGTIAELRQLLGEDAERLIHIGRLRHQQLYPIIQKARVAVLPSIIDNFPNVCIEAMLNRQIVIGTREASFDELIADGETGFLVSTASDAELTTAINRALALSAHERDVMTQRAIGSLKRFAPGPTMEALLKLYYHTIERAKLK